MCRTRRNFISSCFHTLLILIILVMAGCYKAQPMSVNSFAEDLRNTILKSDKSRFINLVSSDKLAGSYLDDLTKYIFSTSAPFSVRKFLLRDGILVYAKAFSSADDVRPKRFLIVYFDPLLIDFRRPVSLPKLKEQYNVGYVETEVVREGNK